MSWLAADHPHRLAVLADIEWHGAPFELPAFSVGRLLLDDLDAVAGAAMLDNEGLGAVRKIFIHRLIEEPHG